MSKHTVISSLVFIMALLLVGILFAPTESVQAGGCDFRATGAVGSGGTANIDVPNVGNNRIVVEIAGSSEARYRVRIGGSSRSGTLNEDGDSRRVSRSFPDSEGTVGVRVESRQGNLTYAIATTNCDDVDGSGNGSGGGGLPSNFDGRASSYGTFGAAYVDDTGIYVYRIGADSQGYLAASATAQQLANVAECPTENVPIAVSEDGRFGIYRLTSCEYQVNIGPDDEGKVEVLVFSSLSVGEDEIRRGEFFLP